MTAMPDVLSILRHPRCVLAKTWLSDGSISPYDRAMRFSLSTTTVSDIRSLSRFMTRLESDPHACLIRGAYDEAEARKDKDFKIGTVLRRLGAFKDQPLHSIMIEVDNFQPLTTDPVDEPEACATAYIREVLPEEFRDVSFHWQLSNSAGHQTKRGVFKAHLWFWLEEAATSDQVRAWADAINLDCDHSVMNPVQIHYTSKPLFEEGVKDPIARRSGFVEGKQESVVIDIAKMPIFEKKLRQRGEVSDAALNDPTALFLEKHGLVIGKGKEGQLHIKCPFEDGHSTPRKSIDETSYFPRGTGGFDQGHFVCFHDTCKRNHSDGDFATVLGVYADDFDDISDDVSLQSQPTNERFRVVQAAEFAKGTPPGWLIKGVLPKAGLAMIYGESSAGKSFFALDLIAAIARGVDWQGRKVQQGNVVYVAAEGASGFRNRLHAYEKHNAIPLAELSIGVVNDTPDLRSEDDKQLIRQIEAFGGAALIVVDTLAQTTPGANENSSEDMGLAIKRCKRIHTATGALVLLIHHSGKNTALGARGWSGLKGAMDAEIEVTHDGKGQRKARVTKQKDGEAGLEFHFRLLQLVLGLDEDDDDITSCVVEYQGAPPATAVNPKGKWQSLAYSVIGDLVAASGKAVTVDAVVVEAMNRSEPNPETNKVDRRRDNIVRAIANLEDARLIISENGFVDLPQSHTAPQNADCGIAAKAVASPQTPQHPI